MKLKFMLVALVLLLAGTAALAQNPPRPPSPDVPFMGGWHPPAALMSDWWNNPDVANELRLTEEQKKQLAQVSTNVKLTLIDAGATGLKSYVRLQALLDADQFDKSAYNQELDTASAAAGKLIKDFGQMALTVRTTLTAEQWHKLESMKAAGRMRPHDGMHDGMHEGMHDHMHTPPPAPPRTPPQ
ncbi:MAG: periplasmic heavy metal sensor [Acidobacteriia bacterium]|nr:periplasmic heavy metal sensor [Terriglobia bacterium]